MYRFLIFLSLLGCTTAELQPEVKAEDSPVTVEIKEPVFVATSIQAESRCDMYGAHYTWDRFFIDEKRHALQKHMGTSKTSAITKHMKISPDILETLKKQVQSPEFALAVERQQEITQKERRKSCHIVIKHFAGNTVGKVQKVSTALHADTQEQDRNILNDVHAEIKSLEQRLDEQVEDQEEKPLFIGFSSIEHRIEAQFSFQIQNRSTEIQKWIQVAMERQEKDGTWKTIKRDIECPCETKCKKKMRRLQPKKSVEILWDYHSECMPIAGLYRLVVYSSTESKTPISNYRMMYISAPKSTKK